MSIIWLVGLAVIWILMISVLIASVSIAPWVPTKRKDLQRIADLVDLRDGQTFVDLGCGSGTTVFALAARGKGKAVGIELSLPLYLFCRGKQIILGRDNVEFRWGNAFKQDWSLFDVFYVFGMDGRMNKVKEKFFTEAKPGARLLSYVFKLEDIEPEIINKDECSLPIRVYRK